MVGKRRDISDNIENILYFFRVHPIFTSPAGAVAKYSDEYVCLCVFLSVCLSVCPRGYLRNHTRDLYQFLCVLPLSVARSSCDTLTIGRIAYRQEGGDGSAQRGRSVIYDCLVIFARKSVIAHTFIKPL